MVPAALFKISVTAWRSIDTNKLDMKGLKQSLDLLIQCLVLGLRKSWAIGSLRPETAAALNLFAAKGSNINPLASPAPLAPAIRVVGQVGRRT